MKSAQPRAAPKACSPRAATFVSRSRNAGRPSLFSISAAIGTSMKSAPMLGVPSTTPRHGSSGPGLEMPMPTTTLLISSGALMMTSRKAASHASRIASGPSATGVRPLVMTTRVPSSMTTAARMFVPPTSRARTGRADIDKPRSRIWRRCWSILAKRIRPPAGRSAHSGRLLRPRERAGHHTSHMT